MRQARESEAHVSIFYRCDIVENLLFCHLLGGKVFFKHSKVIHKVKYVVSKELESVHTIGSCCV